MFFLPSRAAMTLLAASCAWNIGAATVVIQPDSDGTANADTFVAKGTVDLDLSNNNYGGGGSMAISAPGLPKGEFQSLLRIDVSPARNSFDSTFGSGNWIVTEVKLQLQATPPVNALFNGSGSTPQNTAGLFNTQWIADDSWQEGFGTPTAPSIVGVNFNTLPNYLTGGVESLNVGGVPFSFDGSNTSASQYTLRLGTGLLADIYAGTLASFRLFAADSNISALFNTRTFGTVSSRPALIVTAVAVPEPGRMFLLFSGACLFLVRRRK